MDAWEDAIELSGGPVAPKRNDAHPPPFGSDVATPDVQLVDETTDPIGLQDPTTPCLVLASEGSEQRFPLGDLHVIVGRSPSADIITTGDGVALFHVRIEPLGDGRHRVIDLDARSGTLHNGEPIEEAVLALGDRLVLGETELHYTHGLTSASESGTVYPSVLLRSPPRPDVVPPALSESSALVPLPEGNTRLPSRSEPGPLLPAEAGPPARVTQGPITSRETRPVAVVEEPDVIDRLARLVVFGQRYRALLVVLPVLGLLAGLLSMRVIPPTTAAEFELSLVQDPTSNPVDPANRRNLTFFRSAQDNFLGPLLIRRTLEEMGNPDPDPVDIRRSQSLLEFDRSSQFIYHGRYEAASAEEAVGFLQTHLALFLETEVNKAIKVLTAEVETLRSQLSEVDEALTSVETTRVTFREEAGDAQPERTSALQGRLMALRDDRRNAAKTADHLGATVDIARQRVSSEDKIIELRIEDAKPFSDQIVATEQELIAARASGQGPLHPNIKGLEARLAGLEDRHVELLDKGGDQLEVRSNPAYARAKLSLHEAKSLQKVARADLARTNSEIADLKVILDELPAREAEKAALDRRYSALTTQHSELQARLGHSELQLALERRQVEARFDLVQPPTLEPQSNQLTLVTRAGTGTLFGLLLALALGTSHRTWERVDERVTLHRSGFDGSNEVGARALPEGPPPRPRAIGATRDRRQRPPG